MKVLGQLMWKIAGMRVEDRAFGENESDFKRRRARRRDVMETMVKGRNAAA